MSTKENIVYSKNESVNYLFKQIQNELKIFENAEHFKNKKLFRKTQLRLFESEIFVQRIEELLNNLSETFKLIFCLQFMLHDKKLIESHLGFKKTVILYDFIRQSFDIQVSHSDDILLIPQLPEVITMLNLSTLRLEVPRYIDQIPTCSRNLLELFDAFKRMCLLKLKMTAPKDLLKEKVFHQMYRDNEKAKEKIIKLEKVLLEQEESFEEKLSVMYKSLEIYEQKLSELEHSNKMSIFDQVQNSNTAMENIFTTSEEHQNFLRGKLNAAQKRYEEILAINSKQEKEVRDRKSRAQQQLKTIVNRYDKDVGDKTEELANLNEQLETQTLEFNEWFIEFKRQELEYKNLMREKEAEEKQKQDERLLLFIMHRSAITIQRWWRRVLAKKKKQKKKGKKSKK